MFFFNMIYNLLVYVGIVWCSLGNLVLRHYFANQFRNTLISTTISIIPCGKSWIKITINTLHKLLCLPQFAYLNDPQMLATHTVGPFCKYYISLTTKDQYRSICKWFNDISLNSQATKYSLYCTKTLMLMWCYTKEKFSTF